MKSLVGVIFGILLGNTLCIEVVYKYEDDATKQMQFQEGVPGTDVNGGWEYQSPEGQVYKLNYKANEKGFQPEADHLPKSVVDTDEVELAKTTFYSSYKEMEEKVAEAIAENTLKNVKKDPEVLVERKKREEGEEEEEEMKVEDDNMMVESKEKEAVEEVKVEDDNMMVESKEEEEVKEDQQHYYKNPSKFLKPLNPYHFNPNYYNHKKQHVPHFYHHFNHVKDHAKEESMKPIPQYGYHHIPYVYHHYKPAKKMEVEADKEDGMEAVKEDQYKLVPYYVYHPHHGYSIAYFKQPIDMDDVRDKKVDQAKPVGFNFGPYGPYHMPALPAEEQYPDAVAGLEPEPCLENHEVAEAETKSVASFPVYYHSYYPRFVPYVHHQPAMKQEEVAAAAAAAAAAAPLEEEEGEKKEGGITKRSAQLATASFLPSPYYQQVYQYPLTSTWSTFYPSPVQVTRTTVNLPEQETKQPGDDVEVTKMEEEMEEMPEQKVPVVQQVIPFYPTAVQQQVPTLIYPASTQQIIRTPVTIAQQQPVVAQQQAEPVQSPPLPESIFPIFPNDQKDEKPGALAF